MDHIATIVDQPREAPLAAAAPAGSSPAAPACESVTVVVPCFNEEEGVAPLATALDALAAEFACKDSLHFILVDDGSTDGTWSEMERHFGARIRFRLIRHDRNRGISAAILTGMAASETEIVAVIDSDCSYDPVRIKDMLPLLHPGVALVTASPYHAMGRVEGVPEWRLALSRIASWLYRLVLRNKLATYTSCFRVYRRSALDGITVHHQGFTGVAETLARLDLDGWRIAEYPAVLGTRSFGQSKLRILKVIPGHLQLMSEILFARARNRMFRRDGTALAVTKGDGWGD